jgi:hypothetical protein
MAQIGKLPEHRGNKKAGMKCWGLEMSDWEQIQEEDRAHLGQVALCKAVQGSLLRDCPLQGHLNHTKHIWQGILQQHCIILDSLANKLITSRDSCHNYLMPNPAG